MNSKSVEMATSEKNLSSFDAANLPAADKMRIGIVVSEWNHEITGNLLKGARETLLDAGVPEKNIIVHYVPGSFELPLAAQWLIESDQVDGVIALGSVIQGETRHFEFVCNAVAQGIQQVNINYSLPVIFGVLTDDHKQQAIDRSGGKHGNKGIECAVAVMQMIALHKSFAME